MNGQLSVKPRTHVLLTGLDYERIEYGLRMYPAHRVYIVKNGYPKTKEHEELVKKIDNDILNMLLKNLGYKEESVIFWPVDFYDFGKALASIYELLLREVKDGHEVIVNVTCGTKPVALAATLAAAFAKCNVIYVAARDYRRGEHGEVVSKGVITQPIVIGPLFELAEILLSRSKEEARIMLFLLKKKARNITEILIEEGKKPSKKEVARYTYYLNKLGREKIVNIERNSITLTELGVLIAMLIEKRIKVLGEL